METDTTQIDVTELNRAANTLRHVAQRRFDQGFNVSALNVLADCVLKAMHFIASEPGKGTKMKNDQDTQKGPDTLNSFMVGMLEDTITVLALTPRRLSRAEALNLAAWLLSLADVPDVTLYSSADHPALISETFLELLHAVQNA